MLKKKRPKILILTATYGNGHIQVAKTLEATCKELGVKEVIVCDLFAEAHPLITEITQYLYLKCFTIGPQIYRIFYYGIEKIHDKKIATWFKNFGSRRLTSILKQEKPDLIINTFPIIVVPEFRKKSKLMIPTYNVLTDFCLHRIWLHSEIDKYYVASDDLKVRLLNEGTSLFDIHVTGIPIRSCFEKYKSVDSLYRKYNVDPLKKTVLIMAGAHGVLKNTADHCRNLLQQEHVQVIVVCGKNEPLRGELSRLLPHYKNRLHIFGYVEEVDELYRISSCMITKPGGITLSEASALSLPVILYKPVPGQEKENANYFSEKGAAIVVERQEDLIHSVWNLLNNEEILENMKQNMKKISKKLASQQVIEDILIKYDHDTTIQEEQVSS